MNRYIAFLRGINVGGHNRIKMADLKNVLAAASLSNIHTYIQSGNIVFESPSNDSEPLRQLITEAIKKAYGYKVAVIVLSHHKFTTVLQATPFDSPRLEQSVFTLIDPPLSKVQLTQLQELSFEGEWFYLTNKCLYLYSEKGYHKVKFNTNFIEKKTGLSVTTRNYKTMRAIEQLLSRLD